MPLWKRQHTVVGERKTTTGLAKKSNLWLRTDPGERHAPNPKIDVQPNEGDGETREEERFRFFHSRPGTLEPSLYGEKCGGENEHIGSETKKSADRKFHVNYKGQDLALDLIRVHDDRVSSIGGGKYFACVDMKGTDGKRYDIDFFMTGQPGNMKVTETSVHKIDGKPLYNWKEVNGIWKRVST